MVNDVSVDLACSLGLASRAHLSGLGVHAWPAGCAFFASAYNCGGR